MAELTDIRQSGKDREFYEICITQGNDGSIALALYDEDPMKPSLIIDMTLLEAATLKRDLERAIADIMARIISISGANDE